MQGWVLPLASPAFACCKLYYIMLLVLQTAADVKIVHNESTCTKNGKHIVERIFALRKLKGIGGKRRPGNCIIRNLNNELYWAMTNVL